MRSSLVALISAALFVIGFLSASQRSPAASVITTSSTPAASKRLLPLPTPEWSRMQVEADDSTAAYRTNYSSLSPSPAPPPRVHVVTFADKPTLYLHALAATVFHFNNGSPLLVLGLSGRRMPQTTGNNLWNISRRAIKGTDPGKLKKLWFLGALVEDSLRLQRLGLRDTDLILFLDAFDCLVQRDLKAFAHEWHALITGNDQPLRVDADDAVVLLAEHSCWPWPLPGMLPKGKRPRGVSMAYMENHSFEVRRYRDEPPALEHQGGGGALKPRAPRLLHRGEALSRVTVPAEQMCAEVKRRARNGYWSYPNSGVFAGRVSGVRSALRRLQALHVDGGHFEDQGMFHLAMLQHPDGSILLDSNASLFASQFAYNGNWWQRPACFDNYFDPNTKEPPKLIKTGKAPFALHFNGPAGRFRLGWCVSAMMRLAATQGQYLIDVDKGEEVRVELPMYCEAEEGHYVQHQTKGAKPPPGREAVRLPKCKGGDEIENRAWCINDRC